MNSRANYNEIILRRIANNVIDINIDEFFVLLFVWFVLIGIVIVLVYLHWLFFIFIQFTVNTHNNYNIQYIKNMNLYY